MLISVEMMVSLAEHHIIVTTMLNHKHPSDNLLLKHLPFERGAVGFLLLYIVVFLLVTTSVLLIPSGLAE